MRRLFHQLLTFTLALSLILAPLTEARAAVPGGRIDVASYGVTAGLPSGAEYEYLEELAARPDTTVQPIVLLDYAHYDKTTQISPAAMALLSIAVGQFVGGLNFIQGIESVFWQSAAKAGLSSVITQSVAGVVSGEFDLGKILEGAAFAGLSAGLTASVGLDQLGITQEAHPGLYQGLLGEFGNGRLNLAGLLEGGIDGVITSGLSSAVYGAEFEQGLSTALLTTAVNLTLAGVQFEIGELGVPEGSLQHMLLHGLAGCVAAEAQDADCAAGAAAAVAQSLYSGGLEGTSLSDAQQQARAELIGAAIGFAFSGGDADNVGIAAAIALSGIANNRQLHRAEAEWLRENAAAFAREQCEQGNCISEEEALRQLTLQAGRNVDSNLASGTEHNTAAQAFLVASAPRGIIPGTEGSSDYVDTNQTWFSANSDQRDNHLINFAHIVANGDLYGVFADVQSALGGNLDVFQSTLFATNPVDLYDLSPTQRIELIRAYDMAWQSHIATLDPDLRDAYALMVGEMGEAAIRQAIHTITDKDWDNLPAAEQDYLATRLAESYLATFSNLPGGDGGTVRPDLDLDLSGIPSAKLRQNVLAKIEGGATNLTERGTLTNKYPGDVALLQSKPRILIQDNSGRYWLQGALLHKSCEGFIS